MRIFNFKETHPLTDVSGAKQTLFAQVINYAIQQFNDSNDSTIPRFHDSNESLLVSCSKLS